MDYTPPVITTDAELYRWLSGFYLGRDIESFTEIHLLTKDNTPLPMTLRFTELVQQESADRIRWIEYIMVDNQAVMARHEITQVVLVMGRQRHRPFAKDDADAFHAFYFQALWMGLTPRAMYQRHIDVLRHVEVKQTLTGEDQE